MKKWIPEKAAYKLFHEGMLTLAEIEENGIRVDERYLKNTIISTERSIKELENQLKQDEVYRIWAKRFGNKTNLGSPAQLAEVIFKELEYPVPLGLKNKDKSKKWAEKDDSRQEVKLSAQEAAFADCELPFIQTYFKMKKLEKVLSTYLLGIQREVCNGFIHPNFALNIAITYRGSSFDPNFQNVPKRNKIMKSIIRQCYIPREGQQLGEFDFSTLEVRIAACYTKDPQLIKYLSDPSTNMHTDTACDLFLLKPEQVDKAGPRDAAKNMFVFPQFYGSVYFNCAVDLWNAMNRREFKIKDTDILVKDHLAKHGITELGSINPEDTPQKGTFVHHVQQVEKIFWEKRFKVYNQWKKDYWQEYQRSGGLQFLTGFCCSGVFKRNDVLDYAIQGSAFHCLLWCLIQIHKWLKKNKMKTKLVGQIHDSGVPDIHPSERDDFFGKCHEVMTKDLVKHWPWIIVPMEVEMEVAPVNESWDKIELYEGWKK